MKGLLISAVAAGLLALGAPGASADEPGGGCGYDSLHTGAAPTSDPDEFVGVMYVALVAAGHVEGGCWLEVDGVEQPDTSLEFAGDGVVAGAQTITFREARGQSTHLCWSIDHDGATDAGCQEWVDIQYPPQEVLDLLDVLRPADAAACPVFAAAGAPVRGGVRHKLDLDGSGDVRVGDILLWNCPPQAGAPG